MTEMYNDRYVQSKRIMRSNDMTGRRTCDQRLHFEYVECSACNS